MVPKKSKKYCGEKSINNQHMKYSEFTVKLPMIAGTP
jgi:hypothetical protein